MSTRAHTDVTAAPTSPRPPAEPLQEPSGITPGPPPEEESPFARRIAAGLIDLALLLAVFVAFALTVGETGVEGSQVSAFLGGTEAIAYFAFVLVYYFAFEAALAQTPGKLMLRLRVARSDGTPASVGAVALRTLIRVVDWLPFFYLAGFVAMLATGPRRRRLGDLAAGTTVARAPGRRRSLVLAPVAVVALLVAGASVYRASESGDATNTYAAHGISFDYPAGWQQGTLPSAEGGDALWSDSVALDAVNMVVVEAYLLDSPVDVEGLPAIAGEIESLVQRLFDENGGAMTSPPTRTMAAGLQGYRTEGTGTLDGTPYESTLVFLFSGTAEYFFNCQRTADRAAEVEQACDQILDTLEFG